MRSLLIVLDSVGCGAAPDAAAYGDAGADTLGHVMARTGLRLPALDSLGLAGVMRRDGPAPQGLWGRMQPRAAGKDSTTGHWEIAGVVLDQPFAVYEAFPPALLDPIEAEAGLRFIGNVPASGTEIIERLGPEHLRTARPILYTSADSVLQIAAHEAVMPLEALYALCELARRHADAFRIGRVIARPFAGEPGRFRRTPHRHDFAMRPPRTVLEALTEAGHPPVAIGKVADLFAGQGIARSLPTGSNAEGMRRIAEVWDMTRHGLVFANLVDFDTEYGHRRDAIGYARALADFDAWLGGFLPKVGPDDLLIVTADHGNDPLHHGTDHTREEVPLLVRQAGRRGPLGTRAGFGDVAATLADFHDVPWSAGRSCLA
ncbi:phosphopentomutase [Paracraurococcus lichenis]|uniref:Phosphopentomutase n=1 Tax=Paracraurococcus lichenis TaxID=3064888 RepID=A0ABT9E7Z9_9PROT|nr:phosphopentomutase [Paracraurococcus sp. LOR1-02]MDO9712327.1 phosphopentomutase [Paracraurococcus sp. LOR1-02]